MLGNIDRRAAIFAAERDALEDAQDDEQGGCDRPDLGVGRKETDQESRPAHHRDRDQERALAAHDFFWSKAVRVHSHTSSLR